MSAPPAAAAVVVDAHAHVFRAVSPTRPRAIRALYPAGAEARVEHLLERMAAAGVDRAVLVAVSPDDRYAGECARRDPGRFAAVAVYDPARPPGAQVGERNAEGYRALRMERLGDPAVASVEQLESYAALARMAETGLALWFYGELEQLRLLQRVSEHLPELVVVVNHLGFCPGEAGEVAGSLAAMRALARSPGVHAMLSGEYAYSAEAYPHADLAARTRALHEAFGARRLLRASDFPWIDAEPGYGETLALLDHCLPGLDRRARAAIAGGTALRLFWGAGQSSSA